MRILQIINSLETGGAEKLVATMSPLLQSQGIKTDVLIFSGKSSMFLDELNSTSTLNIYSLKAKWIYNPLLIFRIIPYLNKYPLVHVHLFPAFYFVVLAKWISFSKVKIVYTEHNTHNKRRDHFLLKILDRLIYKGIHHIVTISEKVSINLKNHLQANFQSSLIYNGVDVSEIERSKPFNKTDFFDGDAQIIIQVSSFRIQKDQNTLIRSMPLLPERFKLLLVGDGKLKNESELLTESLNLNQRVKFLGNRQDVYRLLKTADFVVLSSNYEGLSLSSIEGMAANKPFIASNVEGLSDIVDGYGLLFEKGNSEELAKLILELENDPVLYSKIADRCFKRALSFDLSLMVQSHIKLYNKLLNA